MTDGLFFIPFLIWLTLTIAVGNRTKGVFTQKYKEKTREFTKDERQIISQLAEDMNLLLYQSIAVWALFIIAILANFFALVTIVLSPINEMWAFIFSLFFMSVSYLFFYITTKMSDVVIEARKRYIANKENNRDSQLYKTQQQFPHEPIVERISLRNSVLHYTAPTEPVAIDDWDALQ